MILHSAKHDNRPSQDDEDRLDQVLEDSFPASDPPSSTPLTSIGPREHRRPDDDLKGLWEKVRQVPMRLLIAGAGATIGVCALIFAVRRARRPQPTLLARAVPDVSRVVAWRPPAKMRSSWKRFRRAA
jgi:hypothetical protein